MLLYVAPSDNVKEHIEFLAKGGEFLTHLWALLSHAGILDRGQRNVVDMKLQGLTSLCPGEESHGDALRFRRASSHPLTCAEKRAAIATCAPTQPAISRNYVDYLSPYEQHQHSTRQPQGRVASDSKLQFAGVDSWPPDTGWFLVIYNYANIEVPTIILFWICMKIKIDGWT
ncbi:hypothetical protein EJB05_13790, partial [Eragrostis curvula]